MQFSDVISINLWQILISLCNLLILFLILKRFLYSPVKKAMAKRREGLEEQYHKAQQAQDDADAAKEEWTGILASADKEAEGIIKAAAADAEENSASIIADAHKRADAIVSLAQEQAKLEQKKAQDGIKREVVDISSAIAEKMLAREINIDDHREMIDSVISQIGEENDGDK